MDALALLCTLHADGPATVRRLRSLGCGDIRDFASRDASVIAEDLDVEPAAARRLLREARLLAERIGDAALDAEEAPSVPTRSTPAPELPALVGSEPASKGGLDREDLDLVARIVAGADATAQAGPRGDKEAVPKTGPQAGPDEVPAAEPADAESLPAVPDIEAQMHAQAQAQMQAQMQAHMQAPLEGPITEPAADSAVALPSEGLPAEATPAEAIPAGAVPAESLAAEPVSKGAPVLKARHGALTAGCLPGLDEIMLEDLQAAGIHTLAELGGAESLNLTRNLGVTFAQARRLRFLARRAASALPAVAPPSESAAAEPPAAAPAAGSSSGSPPGSPSGSLAGDSIEPPVGEPSAADVITPAAPPVAQPAAPAAEPRRAFWEPRGFLAEDVNAAPEPQGVRVDPSEIEARPRFGDQFARAAREGKAQQAKKAAGQTVLGWNFEIPRPAEEELPLKALGNGIEGGAAKPASNSDGTSKSAESQDATGETKPGATSGEAAGPFA